jgi:dynein heavy chain
MLAFSAVVCSLQTLTLFPVLTDIAAQDHYDFGMRAVKTVIVAAGNLKRTQGSVMTEDQIVLSAMADVNEPKFLQADLLLFQVSDDDLTARVCPPIV